MAHRVCPVWIGYLLASPLRRLWQDPKAILRPYAREGAVVLEPGPGMGFFTLELAEAVGARGRVVAVDVQPRMLVALRRRADRKGLASRIDAREVKGEHLPVDDLKETVDFVLLFAMVHEVPNQAVFWGDIAGTLKLGGKTLIAEPAGHVNKEAFAATLEEARRAGLVAEAGPRIARTHTALLTKSA
jgi:ubiquinone/menaquinone biosynthesis C-methylase UbiE